MSIISHRATFDKKHLVKTRKYDYFCVDDMWT